MVKDSFKALLAKVTTEIISIIVAVLFALWANDWWAERQLKIQVNSISIDIVAELQINLTKLKKSHEHHTNQIKLIQEFKKSKNELLESDYADVNKQLYRKGIFQPAELFLTHWEIAADKQLLSEISQQKLKVYKPAYKALKLYNEQWKTIGDSQILIALLAKKQQEKLEITMSMLSQFWWIEKLAINKLEEAISSE